MNTDKIYLVGFMGAGKTSVIKMLLGLVRPLLKGRNTGPGGQLNAIEAEALDRPALPAPAKELSPTKEQERLDQARHLAKQNPIAVANIVKTWINGEG